MNEEIFPDGPMAGIERSYRISGIDGAPKAALARTFERSRTNKTMTLRARARRVLGVDSIVDTSHRRLRMLL